MRGFQTAIRGMRKAGGYTFINLLGLAVGLACCLLIGLHVLDELRYDRFHERADEIYRVSFSDSLSPGLFSLTPALLAPAMEEHLPVAAVARLYRGRSKALRHAERVHDEEAIYYADAEAFALFSYDLRRGDPTTALAGPGRIVLTETLARKYFGTQDPMGQTLLDEEGTALTVSGVMADVPHRTHLPFDGLISFDTLEDPESSPWSHQGYTFVLLPGGAGSVEAGLARLVAGPLASRWEVRGLKLHLEPLTDLYLHSHAHAAGTRQGNARDLYLFSWIGLLILLVACINYTNLATARASRRAREVGVRKVLGASRRQLARQFVGEAVLTALTATVFALVLVELALPLYNAMADKALVVPYREAAWVVPALLGVGILVGVLAGGYPAFFLSRFNPAAVLKGVQGRTHGGAAFRRGLVILQFAASTALLSSTFVIYHQLDYLRGRPVGFDRAQLIQIHLHEAPYEAFKQEVTALPGVVSASASFGAPMHGYLAGMLDLEEPVPLHNLIVDADYLQTLGIELVEGRNFSAGDGGGVLLNETAVRLLEASGRTAAEALPAFGAKDVIGVVKDFHTTSLHEPIVPTALMSNPHWFRALVVRLGAQNQAATLAAIEAIWHRFVPSRPFGYAFLDDLYNVMYRSDERFGQLFALFAGLAIGIACLGLLGLAAFATEQRTKEIGIRKALGARVTDIIFLLTRESAVLVAVAFALAVPPAAYAMHRWLDGFAYRVELPWLLFALSGAIVLALALTTVAYQTTRAARAAPVTSLRHE